MLERGPVRYDPVADCLYVTLSKAPVDHTRTIDDLRMVDLAASGEVVGVEFIGVLDGLDLHDIPRAAEVERLLRASELPLRITA